MVKVEKKEQAKEKQFLNTQLVNEKIIRGEKILSSDLKLVLAYILFATGSKDPVSSLKNNIMRENRLNSFENKWWDYIPLRSNEDLGEHQSQKNKNRILIKKKILLMI